ncbi:hypothetical protein [uncultured Acinetobacter sp.]|uniref:hypothetical protein n=1 Tax=uncultured Acinetobacter sp. TaxID=165433 RepID=UPI0026268FA2|nr:hypothetical protein [uncultured Acinetobacter sp.]
MRITLRAQGLQLIVRDDHCPTSASAKADQNGCAPPRHAQQKHSPRWSQHRQPSAAPSYVAHRKTPRCAA